MPTPVKLLVYYILAHAMKPLLANCGNLCRHSIASCAIAYTDFWAAYAAVLPSKRHRAMGKETRKTSYIERLNNTLRQRVSRLVRKTLSFSKSLENHIGVIWYFIHHYNASLLV
jgi:insertion element IS1 protein InsB